MTVQCRWIDFRWERTARQWKTIDHILSPCDKDGSLEPLISLIGETNLDQHRWTHLSPTIAEKKKVNRFEDKCSHWPWCKFIVSLRVLSARSPFAASNRCDQTVSGGWFIDKFHAWSSLEIVRQMYSHFKMNSWFSSRLMYERMRSVHWRATSAVTKGAKTAYSSKPDVN